MTGFSLNPVFVSWSGYKLEIPKIYGFPTTNIYYSTPLYCNKLKEYKNIRTRQKKKKQMLFVYQTIDQVFKPFVN